MTAKKAGTAMAKKKKAATSPPKASKRQGSAMKRARAKVKEAAAAAAIEDNQWMEGYAKAKLSDGAIIELLHESEEV